jgi:hypothetical protein
VNCVSLVQPFQPFSKPSDHRHAGDWPKTGALSIPRKPAAPRADSQTRKRADRLRRMVAFIAAEVCGGNCFSAATGPAVTSRAAGLKQRAVQCTARRHSTILKHSGDRSNSASPRFLPKDCRPLAAVSWQRQFQSGPGRQTDVLQKTQIAHINLFGQIWNGQRPLRQDGDVRAVAVGAH